MNSKDSPFLIKIINCIKSIENQISNRDYHSNECLDCLKRIDNSFNEEKQFRLEISQILVKFNYVELALKCLEYYAEQGLFENENIWPCAFYLLRSIWNYSDVSNQFAILSIGFIPILLDLISSDSLLPNEQEEDEKLIKISLNIMNNIARNPETKIIFQKYHACKILKKLCQLENEHLRVIVYSILSHIVSEHQQDILNDSSSNIIQSLTIYLRESLLRKERTYKGLSTNEYLDCLAKLAVTKENKQKIIAQNGIIDLFNSILNNNQNSDNQNEKSNVLVCIWNLSFDPKICELLKNNKVLIDQIINLKNSSPYEDLQRRSSGILFTLNEFQAKIKTPLKPSTQHQHIMISYNSGSREMCLKIKEELKLRGNQSVWIDVEQIYGSSLTSMAEAVESASVILMCITEKYYLSPNCRLEAEYAVRLQKPIIPLIMQENYMPYGWLGIIIGSKIYYKFTDPNQFEAKFSSLLKEINSYTNQSQLAIQTHTNTDSKQDSSLKLAFEWTNKEVKQWISSLGLSNWIQNSEIFLNINGSMLKELDQVKKTAPDFFYNLIKTKFTSNEHFHLHDLLKFSAELSILFA